LTRNDVTNLGPSGGPITRDTTGAEHYATIFAFVESPHEPGVFWAGSDDGLIHLSRDGGKTWANVTPAALPEWTVISMIEPSPHDPATSYVAATRYKLDDFQPYLYKTNDYGRTWTTITSGIPDHDFTRVIREDPGRRGLLYAGTETGIYVSFNDGITWQSLQQNLPVVPVYDLVVKEHDLVAATHGRSFWILDDLTPLHQLTDQGHLAPEIRQAPAHLFPPGPTLRMLPPIGGNRQVAPGKNYMIASGYPATYYEASTAQGEKVKIFLDAGANPPAGVVVTYYLREQPTTAVTLSFRDAQGQLIKSFTSQPADTPPSSQAAREPRVPNAAGLNRFVWNMRYPDAHAVPGDVSTERSLTGPLALPGTYQVELSLGDQKLTTACEIRPDPRVSVSQADLEAQFALLMQIRDKLSDTHDAINQMHNVRQQVEEWVQRTAAQPTAAAVAEAAKGVTDKLTAIEQELIERRIQAPLDMIHYPTRLNAKLAAVSSVVASADAAPTQPSYEVFQDLGARIDRQLERWREVLATDVASFNSLVRDAAIPAIVPKTAV
jgi:hypothetical protein